MTFRLMAALLSGLLAASTARAQFDSGAVLGTIRDTSGAVLPGVAVTLLNLDTGIAAERSTDGRGGYEFVTVRAGSYMVKAELSGFVRAVSTGQRNIMVKFQGDPWGESGWGDDGATTHDG